MKLVIFGSTGSVGRYLVSQALAQGHNVTAFARNPSALNIEHQNLALIAGNVLDPNAVSTAVQGMDGALITLGSKKLTGKIRSIGTQNIISAMQQRGVSRLVCQTTLGVGDSHTNLNFFWKYLMFGMLLRFVFNDHVVQESIVENSALDWVIVRPASFTDGPATDSYKHGFGGHEPNLSLTISREDVASFMLEQVQNDRYLHQKAAISN